MIDAFDADRVIVQYRILPLDLSLAYLDPPSDPVVRKQCQERLQSLAKGKQADLLYSADFGTDDRGSARVQLMINGMNINQALVEAGLASYRPGTKTNPIYENILRVAQDKAQQAKRGMWSLTAPQTPAANRQTIAKNPDKSVESPISKPSGAFCAELNGKYYFPSDDQAVVNINPQRLIYYPDEAAAKRAGKLRNPIQREELTGPVDVVSADSSFDSGKELYQSAIAKGNSDERDQLYEQAFVQLTKAMQSYGQLVDQHPDDAGLAEKLRFCMQLRYGSMKQRRVH